MRATFQSRQLPGPAGQLAVTASGWADQRTAVVLLHPINTAGVVWHSVLPLLDMPAVAIDLRGHGQSVWSGPYTVDDGYVPDVLAVLDGLHADAVHLVGGSLGGAIALALAARYPDRVLSVTTFGSTLATGASHQEIEAMVGRLERMGSRRYFADLTPTIVGPKFRAEPRLLDVIRVAGNRPEAVVGAILRSAFGADIRNSVSRVLAPVLAVAGTADPTCPPEMTVEIATATGGRTVILDGVGHLPMVEVPSQVAALINQHTQTGIR
ncbi:alpha/beta fold hydrolase [Mycolicibacterium sp. HS_4_1]